MEDLTLRIDEKRYTGESTVISFRLPKDMLQDVDEIAQKTGRTRNEILGICLGFALKHTEIVLNNNES